MSQPYTDSDDAATQAWFDVLAGRKPPGIEPDDQLAAAVRQVHALQLQADMDRPEDEAKRRRLELLFAAQRGQFKAGPSKSTERVALGATHLGGGQAGGSGASANGLWGRYAAAAAVGLASALAIGLFGGGPGSPSDPMPGYMKGGGAASAPASKQLSADLFNVASPQAEQEATALRAQLEAQGVKAALTRTGDGGWLLEATVDPVQAKTVEGLLARHGVEGFNGGPLQLKFIALP
ncbi:MAG: hypothetical protein ACK5O3_14865 [Burkholderiales bacterium]